MLFEPPPVTGMKLAPLTASEAAPAKDVAPPELEECFEAE